jgi:hypothetical protein
MSNGCDCWIEKERDDATASRPAINLPSPGSSAFPANSFFASSTSITNHLATMSFRDEPDFDMLFDDAPEYSHNQNVLSSVDSQLSRLNKHQGVITQIEAVFETVADALLNERAGVTISLTSSSSNEFRDISARSPKAVFNFPGKTANDAWRFCR